MLTLILRDDCALCDQAWEILHAAGVRDFEPCYIDGEARLENSYGSRVPVLRSGSGHELDWPFTTETLRAWLVLSAPESGRS